MKTLATLAALCLLLLGGYVGAYLALGESRQFFDPTAPGRLAHVERSYSRLWMTLFFFPASLVESQICGVEVHLVSKAP